MKFSTSIILLAAAVGAAALPAPMSEADIDTLRAQGVSEVSDARKEREGVSRETLFVTISTCPSHPVANIL